MRLLAMYLIWILNDGRYCYLGKRKQQGGALLLLLVVDNAWI